MKGGGGVRNEEMEGWRGGVVKGWNGEGVEEE